jgi:SNF2 family DNA or RNA helicase
MRIVYLNSRDDLLSLQFEKAVTSRIKLRDERGLSTLRNTMVRICLRRTKAQVHSTIKLVDKIIENRHITMPAGVHKDTHDALYEAARQVFLGFLRGGLVSDIADNFMAFLELILRVRQSCCHAGLVPKDRREQSVDVLGILKKSGKELSSDLANHLLAKLRGHFESEQLEECVICSNELEEDNVMILRECKHVLCSACLEQIRCQVCPLCRTPFGPDDMLTKNDVEEGTKKEEGKKTKADTTRHVKNAAKLGRSPTVRVVTSQIRCRSFS